MNKGFFKLNNKRIKFIIILLFGTGAFILVSYGILEQTSRPSICSKCHMMKPEYYTWQASSHKKIECITCHIPPGFQNFFKYRLKSFKEIYFAVTSSYASPIVNLSPVADEACNRCHNMSNRYVSPTGDLIIPHDVHARKKVSCSKCHGGVAHAGISKRKVTYRTDYDEWNSEMGTAMMKDEKHLRPDMDVCMRCHRLLKAPVACKACHKTSMLPDDHKSTEFKYQNHGKVAAGNLSYCDSCHSYMTSLKVEVAEESKSYENYLNRGKQKKPTVSVKDYSRLNTFCKGCHGKRPPSHGRGNFITGHGEMAQKDNKRCMTCHDNFLAIGPAGAQGSSEDNPVVTSTTCGNCHPSPHSRSVQWKNGYHPVQLPARPQITGTCYDCHAKKTCGRCHRG